MTPEEPYNPLQKERLAESVAQALLLRPLAPLGAVPSFPGAGIYALYYKGPAPLYRALAGSLNEAQLQQRPIYVGQAAPQAARKGEQGAELAARLKDHARSLSQCQNLDLADFLCRYLVVDDVWITLAESMLIAKFEPVWNLVLLGFGNHDPGGPRRKGLRPPWDTVHPGRRWASAMPDNPKPAADWIALVERALAGDRTAQVVSVEQAVGQDAEGTD